MFWWFPYLAILFYCKKVQLSLWHVETGPRRLCLTFALPNYHGFSLPSCWSSFGFKGVVNLDRSIFCQLTKVGVEFQVCNRILTSSGAMGDHQAFKRFRTHWNLNLCPKQNASFTRKGPVGRARWGPVGPGASSKMKNCTQPKERNERLTATWETVTAHKAVRVPSRVVPSCHASKQVDMWKKIKCWQMPSVSILKFESLL